MHIKLSYLNGTKKWFLIMKIMVCFLTWIGGFELLDDLGQPDEERPGADVAGEDVGVAVNLVGLQPGHQFSQLAIIQNLRQG